MGLCSVHFFCSQTALKKVVLIGSCRRQRSPRRWVVLCRMLGLFRIIVTVPAEQPGVIRRCFSPKAGKSNRSARARFSPIKTKEGFTLLERMRAGKNHRNGHKTSSRLKRLSSPTVVSAADHKSIMRLLLK